jgi:hypothetical protein
MVSQPAGTKSILTLERSASSPQRFATFHENYAHLSRQQPGNVYYIDERANARFTLQ